MRSKEVITINITGIDAEKERLVDLLERADVPQHKRDVLQPVIDNLSWQRGKLEEAMQQMKEATLTVEYDNGGGQKGTRENPIFRAYISLWKAYLAGLDKVVDTLPDDLKSEALPSGISVLDKVKKMRGEGA